jgi:hypothetical protein
MALAITKKTNMKRLMNFDNVYSPTRVENMCHEHIIAFTTAREMYVKSSTWLIRHTKTTYNAVAMHITVRENLLDVDIKDVEVIFLI